MTPDEILFEVEAAMEKAVHFMVHEFATVRTGKATPALVESLDVHAYDSVMKLKQLAVISVPEPRMLVIQPFDAGTVRNIEKAILESKVGITPSVDGKIIRLPVPELSEDRRKDLVKTVKHMAEEGRVRVRHSRQEGMHEVKKAEKEGEITEDDREYTEDKIQKLTDQFVKKIDEAISVKEAEIMKV
jgi:ribosome recycling factor